jgi:pimeloyl-ACP methyl ester carboxylesterase
VCPISKGAIQMPPIYKTAEGERLVREHYLAFLKYWPVPNEHVHIATSQGETFVVACGDVTAPPLLLLHPSAGNSVMWIGDIAAFAARCRVYAIDMIGEAGLSAPSRPPLDSGAYAQWLDDVLDSLSLDRVSIVGISFGGWLALDYAIRRPDRVARLAVLCPGGIGRQKLRILFTILALRACGAWGKRRLAEKVFGRQPAKVSPASKAFMNFIALIHEHFRPRLTKLPVFPDTSLRRLTMPVLAIVGARDVTLDSAATKRRLERTVPEAEVTMLPDAGHMITGHTEHVVKFLIGVQGDGGNH